LEEGENPELKKQRHSSSLAKSVMVVILRDAFVLIASHIGSGITNESIGWNLELPLLKYRCLKEFPDLPERALRIVVPLHYGARLISAVHLSQSRLGKSKGAQ
jgi:hypothetical protein